MNIDERSNLIVDFIIRNIRVTNEEIQNEFSLSRRQVDYSIGKINDWLLEKNLNQLNKENGKYFLDENISGTNLLEIKKMNLKSYIPSREERIKYLQLILVTRDEELSLNHLIDLLDVSKNTVLSDIKEAQANLKYKRLNIMYSREDGYHLEGSEWNKRSLLIEIIQHISNHVNGNIILKYYMNLNDEEIDMVTSSILKIEEEIDTKFIDVDLNALPFVFSGIVERISQNKIIDAHFLIDFQELSDTKEFQAINILLKDDGLLNIPVEEKLYLTLQLLTSKSLNRGVLSEDEIPKLKQALAQVLENFENKSLVMLKDKETLIEKMFIHFKPAYYRIKYKLTTNYTLMDNFTNEFSTLQFFMKESIKPLETFLGCRIPEKEVFFLTIFIAGHIIDYQENKDTTFKTRAVVVCPNGITVSQLMERSLIDLFPELYFYPAMSIREFNQFTSDFDIVFSAVPLKTDKSLFIIDPMLSKEQGQNLREQLINLELVEFSQEAKINSILQIVEKNAVVTDPKRLEDELRQIIELPRENNKKVVNVLDTRLKDLDELLTPEMITITNSVKNWNEALDLTAQPLLNERVINKDYLKAIKLLYPTLPDYILLSNRIAIPHAETESGAQQLGMSMLVIKDGLKITEELTIYFIVMMSVVDKEQHLDALLQLHELSEHEDTLIEMRNQISEDSVHHKITKFLKEKQQKNFTRLHRLEATEI